MYKLLLLFVIVTTNAKKYRSKDFNKTYPLGFIPKNTTNLKEIIQLKSLPERFDWRNKINVPIRSQETCGSCWAFATVSPIEYLYSYKTKLDIHLSEQYLISCNSHKYSCNGGWWDYDDLIKNGIVLSEDYPYDSTDELCKKNIKIFDNIKIINWGYVGDTIEQIKSAILQYGPVVSGVAVDDNFYNYRDGIYDHDSDEKVNHAVVLVGWDDSLNSWILRNSWSTRWGSKGYMYIEYGVSSIGTNVAYVSIDINSYLR
jgi:C1A family cysteine protease